MSTPTRNMLRWARERQRQAEQLVSRLERELAAWRSVESRLTSLCAGMTCTHGQAKICGPCAAELLANEVRAHRENAVKRARQQ